MSKPVLYYDDRSPPVRSCLMLIEMLKLDVELKFVNIFKGEQYQSEFLEINPKNTVPVLVDGDLILTDSHVILLHLCEKYERGDAGRELLPKDYKQRMEVLNVLFFECGTLFREDSNLLSAIIRDKYPNVPIDQHRKRVQRVYSVLDAILKRHKFMATDHLTLADISVVTTLSSVALIIPVDSEQWPLLSAWFASMQELPMCSANSLGLEKLRVSLEEMGELPQILKH